MAEIKIQEQIEDKLTSVFSPDYLSVENESHMHRVPADSETHFKVVLVSEAFVGKPPVKRHQSVYKALCEEVKKIHALALHTFTREEWAKSTGNLPSPKCSHKIS